MTALFITPQQGDSIDIEPQPFSVQWSRFGTVFIRWRTPKWRLLGEYLTIDTQERASSRWTRDESLRAVGQFVSDKIGTLPEVVKVIGDVHEDFISVCTIIDSPDPTARYRVYEVERNVLEAFPHLSFDFRVVNLTNFPGTGVATLSTIEGETLYEKPRTVSDDKVRCGFNELPQDVSYAYA